MAERDRSQLVISLGTGLQGELYRKAFDEEAERLGTTVSSWARRVLLREVGVETESSPTRSEHEDLRRRVAELELRTVGITSHPTVWLGCSPDCGSLKGYGCDCGYERRKREQHG
jgi:hypothetical protein